MKFAVCALNYAMTAPFRILNNLDNLGLNKVVRIMENAFSSFKIPMKTFVTFVQNVCECSFTAIL